jgi:hypothetical protein
MQLVLSKHQIWIWGAQGLLLSGEGPGPKDGTGLRCGLGSSAVPVPSGPQLTHPGVCLSQWPNNEKAR